VTFKPGPPPSQKISPSKAPRVIIVSIDALDPRYLYLNKSGEPGGLDGNWLMPNIRRFLAEGVWFENARCHMPAVTDPNHLNVLSGGSSAQSGICSVSLQLFDWQKDGRPNIVRPSLSWARDDEGRPVDTQTVVIAMQGPGIVRGKILSDPSCGQNHRLADIAVTLCSMLGLKLTSTTIGRDRTEEITGA